MTRPYLLLAAVLLWIATTGGAFLYGGHVKAAEVEAAEARDARTEQRVTEAASQAAASAIAGLDTTLNGIRQDITHAINDLPVYRDCRHDAGVMRNVNRALSSGSKPVGGGVVPPANPAH